MNRRADGIGRDEEDAQLTLRHRRKGVAEMAAERSAKSFGIGNDGELAGSGSGGEGFGELKGRASDGGETGAFRRIAKQPTERGAGPGVSEVLQQAGPFVDIFPGEE